MNLLLKDLVPSSIVKDVSCFTLHDKFPCDNVKIDIIVCTSKGEIIEFFQRNVVLKTSVVSVSSPKKIEIHRNSVGNMHYLTATNTEIFIFIRSDCLKLVNKFDNIDKYELDDQTCSGNVSLRVWFKEDAMPIDVDENFENMTEEFGSKALGAVKNDTLPVINMLKSKLIEANYIVSQNKKAFSDILSLRQRVAFSMYSNMYPEITDTLFTRPLKKVFGALRILVETPWIRLCNKKIVVVIPVINDSESSVTDIELFIHNNERNTLHYEVKIYDKFPHPPYWIQQSLNSVNSKAKANIAVMIDVDEIEYNVADAIKFNGVLIYKLQGTRKVLPFDKVILSHLDTMNEKFDVFFYNELGVNEILAVMATSLRSDLEVIHLPHDRDSEIVLCDVLCQYLKMDIVPGNGNMIIHRKSPYHILNGVMILFDQQTMSQKNHFNMTVFSRCRSQVLSLTHLIYDAVPYRLIITLSKVKLSMNMDKANLECTVEKNKNDCNFLDYGQSLLEQITLTLKYYDECIMTMGRSHNQGIINMLGVKIDLTMNDNGQLEEYLSKLKEKILLGIDYLNGNKKRIEDSHDDIMIVDDDSDDCIL